MGAIVLFDGVCKFCNRTVNFIIEHDSSSYFTFAPLQSETGKRLLRSNGLEEAASIETDPESIVLIEDGTAYTSSSAALRIAAHLPPPWSWLKILTIVPEPLRDWFYEQFAQLRYRLFGKTDQCMIPSPDVKARFL
jgi:predicted DCC family thiol-disulfide oxidoreductase YuxK